MLMRRENLKMSVSGIGVAGYSITEYRTRKNKVGTTDGGCFKGEPEKL
jgi:hypothetical protein